MGARAVLAIAVLVVLAGAVYLAVGRLEGSAPVVEAPERVVVGAQGTTVEIAMRDDGTGLRAVSVRLMDQSGTRSLLEESWPGDLLSGAAPGGAARRVTLTLDPAAMGTPDGSATLAISVRDWAWRDGLDGNRNELSIPVEIDTRPPRVRAESGLTYVQRGGSGAAVYRAGDDAVRHGIRVGDAFFPGHPHPADPAARVALFAIPVDAAEKPRVEIVGIDEAGNEAAVAFPARVMERRFPQEEIEISSEFVEQIAAPLARATGLPTGDAAETFRAVNETLRARNEATVREQVVESDPVPRFGAALVQLPGSKVMSRFGESRIYRLRGAEISRARHLGFDLASVTLAPITAAGAGRVVFADDLGIYGRCVIVDHGLGLASLYGHLSQLAVEPGDEVTKGQRLGRSGMTGLAAGDHLHFAILVGGHYADPMEWWDPKWVRSHVSVRLERSSR